MMSVKDIIIQEINENSEYKHFVEYGEGRFMTSDALEAIAESLVKKLNLPVVGGSYPTANDIWSVARNDDMMDFRKWYNKHFGNYR
jgi:hypothetical protein